MNYINEKNNQIVTDTWLKATGVNIGNQEVMKILGWYPIRYRYPQYDKWTEKMVPDGDPAPVLGEAEYLQRFKVLPLDEAELATSLDIFKREQLDRLHNAWEEAEKSGKLMSSVGFEIDANERADRDIRGLITRMEAKEEGIAMFCDANNETHPVSLENLKTMQLEVIEYGQAIYARKWQIRTAIETASTFEEVRAIEISFEGV